MPEEEKTETRRSKSREKKPYRKPQILYREPLEAMAAVCSPSPPAKQSSGVPLCPGGPVSS